MNDFFRDGVLVTDGGPPAVTDLARKASSRVVSKTPTQERSMATAVTTRRTPTEQRAARLKAARQFYLRKKGVTQAAIWRRASVLYGEPISEGHVSRVIAGRKMDGKKAEAVQAAVRELTKRRDFFTATEAELLA